MVKLCLLIMKKLLSIIFIILLAISALNNVFSQEVRYSDSTGVRSTSAGKRSENQNSNNPENKPAGVRDARGNQGIKNIKSARPDMSRAKGARPPEIVRPSGSRIPKGMGKPGGAVKRGGR